MNNLISEIKEVYKLSRPRFYFYTGGTFLIGYFAALNNLSQFDFRFFVLLIYFLIPANILIYGINDIYDELVDRFNKKKEDKEIKINKTNIKFLKKYVYFSLFLSFLIFFLLNDLNIILMLIFLFLGIFYSLPPIRFKTKIFLDFISNSFYIIPALIGYYFLKGELPNYIIIYSSILWIFSMHLFSAIVDIKPDMKANITTSATFLGYKKSLILCFVFYFLSWFLMFKLNILGNFIYLYLIYPILPLYLLLNKKIIIDKVYWYFPYINTILGFILYLIIVYNKIL